MSNDGDRQPPKDATPGHDPDDLVGFASPQSLAGRPREPEPEPATEPTLEPSPEATPEPRLEAAPAPPEAPPEPEPERLEIRRPLAPQPAPEPAPRFGGRDRTPVPDAPMGLYAVYALILFAVPTAGVSAVVGLAAVMLRNAPTDDMIASHHVYQLRTLWTAAIAAVVGVILIVVNLGVFVLFVLVLWLVVRGAWGVWLLTRGRAVPNPRGWWIG